MRKKRIASRMTRRLFFALHIFAFSSTFLYGGQMIRVVTQSADRVSLQFSLPEFSSSSQKPPRQFFNQHFSWVSLQGMPTFPAIVYPLPPGTEVAGMVVKQRVKGGLMDARFSAYLEATLDSLNAQPVSAEKQAVRPPAPFPDAPAVLKTLGQFRSGQIRVLYIFPFQRLDKNRWEAWRQIDVELQLKKGTGSSHSAAWRHPKNPAIELMRDRKIKKPVSTTPTLAQVDGTPANLAQVKITVDRDGIYQVRYEDLIDAGVELPEGLDPWELRLTNKGHEVPFYIVDHEDRSFDPGDYIEFYGEFSRAPKNPEAPDVYLDIYSTQNVYWLAWNQGQGQKMIEEEGLVLETDPSKFRTVYSFPSKIHFEQDRHFDRLGRYQKQIPRDHWFMDRGVFSSEKKDYTLELPDPDTQSDQPVELRIMLHGQTFSDSLPHTVEAFLNQRLVLHGSWFGQTPFLLSASASQSINANTLNERKNTVTLVNRAPEDRVDNFFVNWIEVIYPRLLKAHQGYLEFTIPQDEPEGLFDFAISGFSTDQISLYKLGASKIIGADIEAIEDALGNRTYQVHFQDEVLTRNVRYVAVEEAAKLKPVSIQQHEPVDLRDPALAADYVIIAYDSLLQSEPLQTLISFRQQQGLTVTAVPVSEIFNQFSGGLFSADGIKKFLQYAYQHWTTPLQYVLLVGDGSFDNRNLNHLGTNLIPVFLRQMEKYGAAVSDHWYSLMTPGDELPDIYVGRLPVNTVEELSVLVAKIIEYETNPQKQDWLNRMLLIGGNGRVFRQQTEYLIRNVLPARLDIHRVYTFRDQSLPQDPFFGGTSDVIDLVNDGVFLVNFMGHGGGAIWADNSLLRLEDVDRLSNKGRYPFVTSMTCFTGAFDTPNRETLAERLLMLPDAGSMAIWASSGLGWTREDFNIVQELFALLAKYGNSLTLGQYLAAAKLSYISKHLDAVGFSILNQYNLLGDPAMHLTLPDQNLDLNLNRNFVQKGDTLSLTGTTEFAQGEGEIQLLNEQRLIETSEPIEVGNSKFRKSITIPQEFSDDGGWIRVYVRSADGQQHSSSAKRISFNQIFVDSLYTTPPRMESTDSVRFYARIEHAHPLVQKQIYVTLPSPDTLNLVLSGSENLYVSTRAFRPLAAGEVLRYYLTVVDNQGNHFTSEIREIQSPRGPDLAMLPNYLKLGGEKQIELQTFAFNLGDAEAKGVVVRFEQYLPETRQWRLVGQDTLDLPKKDRRLARVPFAAATGQMVFRTVIDPENKFSESNETNNSAEQTLQVNLFAVTSELGTSLQQTRSDTIAFDGIMQFYIPPGAVESNLLMQVERQAKVSVVNQPDFHPVLINGVPVVYRIGVAANAPNLQISPVQLFFKADSGNMTGPQGSNVPLFQSNQSHVCRLDTVTQKWIKLADQKDQTAFSSQVIAPGIYGLFNIEDHTPPRVQISVEGQLFSEAGFVPPQPVIGITALDLNGIERSPRGIKIWVDNSPYPFEQLSFVDSAAAYNTTALAFRPVFSAGEHTIRAQVTDAAGNVSEPIENHFKVSDEKKLIFLGNYPNPFENRTTFAFELTDHARDLELKVYTTSGHLIRTITASEIVEDPNPLGPNYHEVTWDARDQFGERVANGLYYFKLKIQFPGKTSEYVGRIARLK